MSAEKDTPEVAPEEATPTPTKASKSGNTRAKPDPEAIRARQDEAIKYIHPNAKKFPDLYAKVKGHIRGHVLRGSKWSEVVVYKKFIGWSELAEPHHRPKLDYMVAVLAIHDYYGVGNPTFLKEVATRGLEAWVNEQLEDSPEAASAPKSTMSENTQQEPRVKIEPEFRGESAASTIRKSIEGENGLAVAAGLKRPAHKHSAEPSNKRANLGSNQAFLAPEPNVATPQYSQQRIVYREAGMQTDSHASVEEASKSMLAAAAKMEQQVQVLQNHNGVLGNLLDKAQVAPARAGNNIVYQQPQYQAQDMIPLQPINRQPPSLYFDPNRDTGGSGQLFRFP
ncbi:hypothetical protein HYE68_000309 [Fusarium pseudograminearum]|nr:hypothetical protein HYE68_000309 [Fusarium pseudograminearum]